MGCKYNGSLAKFSSNGVIFQIKLEKTCTLRMKVENKSWGEWRETGDLYHSYPGTDVYKYYGQSCGPLKVCGSRSYKTRLPITLKLNMRTLGSEFR